MALSREKAAKRALKLLGADRFTAFIRVIRTHPGCFAVRLMNNKLDEGNDLDAIFFTGDTYGFKLSAWRIESHRFRIDFGCLAGPLAGDGGEWDVTYAPDGSISEITDVSMWIY